MEKIKETDIQILKRASGIHHFGNDILLIDNLKKVPIPNTARRTNCIIIGVCHSGKAKYKVDTRDFSVKANEAFIVSERHTLSDFNLSDDFEALCIVLSVNFFHEIIRNVNEMSALFLYSRNHPVMQFSQKEQVIFKKYFDVIRSKVTDRGNHFLKQLLSTLMLGMFYDLSNVIYRAKQGNKDNQSRPDIIFTGFIRLVEENCKTERRVRWYAQQLDITAKYLSETVKHVSRRSPGEWIQNYVCLEMRVLLKNTTKSIKEIAEEMKFPNQSFMGKYFKENVGMSPKKYRKS